MSPYSTSSSSGSSTSGPDPALLGMYQSEYQNALSLNNQNYSNLFGQYNQSVGNLESQINNISGGYGTLSGQVQNTIRGIGQSQLQSIQDQYAAQSGGLSQSLINSGLGNTTVAGSMQRGLTLDSQKAQIALANQVAQLTAGYQAQLGGAQLQSQLTGAQLGAGMSNNFIGALAGYKTPYPSWPPNSSTSRNQGSSFGGGGGGQSGGAGGGYFQGGVSGSNGLIPSQSGNPYLGPYQMAQPQGGNDPNAAQFLANQGAGPDQAPNYNSYGPDYSGGNIGQTGDPSAGDSYLVGDAPG